VFRPSPAHPTDARQAHRYWEGLAVQGTTCSADRRAGFSLVEALVVLTIFGIGIAALMQLSPRATQVATHARTLSVASGLAQAKMEELRSLPKADADLADGTHVDPDNPVQGHYERRWLVDADNPIQGMRRVEVRVRPTELARGDSVAVLVTYF
jgi:prepilin-type N-terminal cleavage/methylation domain-containing protein